MSDDGGYKLDAFMKSSIIHLAAKYAAEMERLEKLIFTSLKLTTKEEQNEFKKEAVEKGLTTCLTYSDALIVCHNERVK